MVARTTSKVNKLPTILAKLLQGSSLCSKMPKKALLVFRCLASLVRLVVSHRLLRRTLRTWATKATTLEINSVVQGSIRTLSSVCSRRKLLICKTIRCKGQQTYSLRAMTPQLCGVRKQVTTLICKTIRWGQPSVWALKTLVASLPKTTCPHTCKTLLTSNSAKLNVAQTLLARSVMPKP